MQRNFFPYCWPPSPLVLAQPNYFFQIFGKCSKYFQLSKGKNHFFHKSPPLVVLSPKNITCVFSTKSWGGGGTLLMEIFHQKIFLVIYPFPKVFSLKEFIYTNHSTWDFDMKTSQNNIIINMENYISISWVCCLSQVNLLCE